MIWCLTDHHLKLICMYYIRAHIGSGSGLGYKGLMKTRRRCRRHVEPWRFWSCKSLPTMDEGLVIGLALNKYLYQTVGWLGTSCLVLCEWSQTYGLQTLYRLLPLSEVKAGYSFSLLSKKKWRYFLFYHVCTILMSCICTLVILWRRCFSTNTTWRYFHTTVHAQTEAFYTIGW